MLCKVNVTHMYEQQSLQQATGNGNTETAVMAFDRGHFQSFTRQGGAMSGKGSVAINPVHLGPADVADDINEPVELQCSLAATVWH